jgi:hypothetical protein
MWRRVTILAVGLFLIVIIGSYAWAETHPAKAWWFTWVTTRELVKITATPGPFDLPYRQTDNKLTRRLYSNYNTRGNIEAMNANFSAAIVDWKRAEELDETLTDDPVQNCRGEFQRVDIRAAEQIEQEVNRAHVTSAQAAERFEKRRSEMWIPDSCNGP